MRMLLFAGRNAKEILRDPVNLFFGLGFPLILLGLLSMLNASIPKEAGNTMFAIENLAPGLALFGTVFMALFAGMLLAKDRLSSFLMRLFASPMTARDFILGYTLPLLAMASMQAAITLGVSCLLGLPFTGHILTSVVVATITSLLFVGFGLLFGSLLNERAVGGICGALLTNLAGWLSGVFIPLALVGGVFESIAHALPFYHGVQSIQAALQGQYQNVLTHLSIVLAYTVVIFGLAVVIFRHKMTSDKS